MANSGNKWNEAKSFTSLLNESRLANIFIVRDQILLPINRMVNWWCSHSNQFSVQAVCEVNLDILAKANRLAGSVSSRTLYIFLHSRWVNVENQMHVVLSIKYWQLLCRYGFLIAISKLWIPRLNDTDEIAWDPVMTTAQSVLAKKYWHFLMVFWPY